MNDMNQMNQDKLRKKDIPRENDAGRLGQNMEGAARKEMNGSDAGLKVKAPDGDSAAQKGKDPSKVADAGTPRVDKATKTDGDAGAPGQNMEDAARKKMDGKDAGAGSDKDAGKKAETHHLGSLSEKYESNGNPGAVSSGKGDAGGVSYGSYQMTSKDAATGKAGGTVKDFLQSSAGAPWSKEFQGLKPGSPEFSKKWSEVAKRDTNFGDAQHTYIKSTHYDPVAAATKKAGVDVDKSSDTFKDVLWSTGVQHGAQGGKNIVERAFSGRDPSTMTDAEKIKAIYTERGRKETDGSLHYFKGNSPEVQKSVANRFKTEQSDALKRLQVEQGH